MHSLTCMYTTVYTHACTCISLRVCTQMHICVCLPACTQTHLHTCTQGHIHICLHRDVYTSTYVCMHKHAHRHAQTHMQAYMHPNIHTPIYYTHTCALIYVYYTYIYNSDRHIHVHTHTQHILPAPHPCRDMESQLTAVTTQDSQVPAPASPGALLWKNTDLPWDERDTSPSYQPMTLSHTLLENSLHSHSESALLCGCAPWELCVPWGSECTMG